MTNAELQIILDASLAETYGYIVVVSDVELFRKRFYKFRAQCREIANTSYDKLSILSSPEPDEVYIATAIRTSA